MRDWGRLIRLLSLALVFCVGLAVAVKSAEPRARTVTKPEMPKRPDARTASLGVESSVMGGSVSGSVTVTVRGLYQHHSAAYWHWRYQHRTTQLQHTRSLLHKRWQPTVGYALRLASAVSGVPYTALSAVAWCESTHNPFATNGRYKGLFQLGWSPFGLSPYDPLANALSAALTVKHDGGWRQWQCRP